MSTLRSFGLITLLGLAACQTAPERRWAHVTESSKPPPNYAPAVMVTSYPTPNDTAAAAAAPAKPASDKTITGLSDRGQASLLENLAKMIAADKAGCAKSKDAPCQHQVLLDSIGISAASGGGDKTPPSIGYVDATSFKRTVVINVLNAQYLPPGDRLQVFTVSVKPESQARFTNYTMAQTQSVNSKFGTITQNTEFDLSGKIDPKLAGPAQGTGEISSSYSNKRAVTSDISEASVPLNVDIQDGVLSVQKHGNAVTDISGNTLVALTMVVPTDDSHLALVVSGASLFKAGQPLGAADATIAADFTRFAPDDREVTAHISINYQLRHIKTGAATYTEGDDTVVLYDGVGDSATAVLIPKDEIVGDKWVIIAQKANSMSPKCELLSAAPLGFTAGASAPLYFADELTARSVAVWLTGARATDVNGHQLTFKVNQMDLDWKTSSPAFQVASRAAWLHSIRPYCQR